jgi:hypothetical protein
LKSRLAWWLLVVTLAAAVPEAAFAQSLEQAARKAARQHDAKVLSARTIKRGQQPVHEIKLLTKKGVVKTVHVPDRRPQKKPK